MHQHTLARRKTTTTTTRGQQRLNVHLRAVRASRQDWLNMPRRQPRVVRLTLACLRACVYIAVSFSQARHYIYRRRGVLWLRAPRTRVSRKIPESRRFGCVYSDCRKFFWSRGKKSQKIRQIKILEVIKGVLYWNKKSVDVSSIIRNKFL